MLPDLDSLACVDALARTLRFSTAAESVHLSPAAFSARIRQAEAQTGLELFRRTTRRVTLTDAGLALLPRIRGVLHEARRLTAPHEPTPAAVTIGTRHELGVSWLLPARAALAAALPHLTVHLMFGSTADLDRALLEGRVDAIVTSRAPSTTRITSHVLHREDYTMVASSALLRRHPLSSADDAAAHVLLDADDTLPLFSYVRAARPMRFSRVVFLGTIAALRVAALDGEGVTVLPRYFVAADVSARRLVRVMSRQRLGHDHFRLHHRASDDERAATWQQIARVLRALPLR